MSKDQRYMALAVKLACDNISMGGGPFGAVIVKDGVVIGKGQNRVSPNNDPTAHAEVMAIRSACSNINSFNLAGSTLYTSCEPCPMCLCAALWARISKIIYGVTREDAAKIGFDDSFFYEQVALPLGERRIKENQLLLDNSSLPFELWDTFNEKRKY